MKTQMQAQETGETRNLFKTAGKKQTNKDFNPALSVYGIVKSHIRDFGFKTSSDIVVSPNLLSTTPGAGTAYLTSHKVADRSSRKDLLTNTDGSIDLYFCPNEPSLPCFVSIHQKKPCWIAPGCCRISRKPKPGDESN